MSSLELTRTRDALVGAYLWAWDGCEDNTDREAILLEIQLDYQALRRLEETLRDEMSGTKAFNYQTAQPLTVGTFRRYLRDMWAEVKRWRSGT